MTDATFTGKEIGQASQVNAYRWVPLTDDCLKPARFFKLHCVIF